MATFVVDFVGYVLEGGVRASGGHLWSDLSSGRFHEVRGHPAFDVAEAGVASFLDGAGLCIVAARVTVGGGSRVGGCSRRATE